MISHGIAFSLFVVFNGQMDNDKGGNDDDEGGRGGVKGLLDVSL
jgi:hypothetical protein